MFASLRDWRKRWRQSVKRDQSNVNDVVGLCSLVASRMILGNLEHSPKWASMRKALRAIIPFILLFVACLPIATNIFAQKKTKPPCRPNLAALSRRRMRYDL